MSRVLVIGDLHIPWERKGYFQFCCDLYEEWDCDTVVFIGDVVDSHAVSFHKKHPDMPGALQEYNKAKEGVQRWYRKFPKAVVTRGNHDERVMRVAMDSGIPKVYMKSYQQNWGTTGWQWKKDHIIDKVYYYHGTGQGGEYPACNAVKKMLMSCVLGHNHTASGNKFYANPSKLYFGCDVGCGIDDEQMAFAYAINNKRRSIISAAVVLDGAVPHVEPMPCGRGEKYHDSNF